ncbi:MAG TPA: PKD domain-containing protein, partial [Acidimicrobiia bacterium]|nr:PKD domain-containing protein [Acidimicrobiia bacterium]
MSRPTLVLVLAAAIAGPARAGPTAAFTFSCSGHSCRFDASPSAGAIVNYHWWWDDETTADTSSPAITHTYTSAATFYVGLTVTDSTGAFDTVTRPVAVSNSRPGPTAAFTFSCSGLSCSFDGSGSTGGIVNYRWSWGDETWQDTASPFATHDYTFADTFGVTLTVTDSAGTMAAITQSVAVISGCNISAPAANANVAAPVSMRAACFAARGHVTRAVDVFVDGTAAWHATASSGNIANVLPTLWPQAGSHRLTVQGTDETGATFSGSITIQVTSSGWDPWQPIAAARLTSGKYAGAFMINPAADAINWYFANLGLLGFAGRFPEYARAHVEVYLANVLPGWNIQDVNQPTAASPQLVKADSDDSYAASLLSLAVRYVNVSSDLAWLNAHLAQLKAVADHNLLASMMSNGLVHVFQDPNDFPLVAYTEDNAEAWKGLRDFSLLLYDIGDADADKYASAASTIAVALGNVLFLNDVPAFAVVWNGATNPLEGGYYPRGVTQLFPLANGVPVPPYQNDDGWAYINSAFPNWYGQI